VKRRTLVAAGVAVAAVGGTVALARRLDRPALDGLSKAAQRVGLRIHAHLGFLDIEDDAYRRFLEDLEQHEGSLEEQSVGRTLLQKFLFSTDFFLHRADETRTIAYRQYYDPYISVCYQPLRAE
jgi:hypothetical protein